jgi:hypothetical protein
MPETAYPVKTTSFLCPLWLRGDLPRETASAYWAGPHGEIVKRSLPGVIEYVQHHFSATDHGFWPSSERVGTLIPPSWQVDGLPEIRFRSAAAALATPKHMRDVFFDEQNVFERALGQPTGPGGGRWWTDGFDDTVGHRVALLLRRRRGVHRATFCHFVHERIGPALFAAGARDLRTYAFLPWLRFVHITPGVAHDNPPERRYHGAVSFGTEDRAAVQKLLASPQIAGLVAEQHTALTAVHAFSVERSAPVIRIPAAAHRRAGSRARSSRATPATR